MTRETKIGLLVGLGFIVVFAVLLSHTGNVPPPGDTASPRMVQNPAPNKPVLNGEIRKDISQPEVIPTVDAPRPLETSPESEPIRTQVEDRVVISLDDLPELPAPAFLEPQTRTEVATADQRGEDASAVPPQAVLTMRAAPKPIIETPQPSAPHAPPTRTTPPDSVAGTEVASNANKVAPKQGPPREYVVQGGDSLVRIAKKHYSSSDPRLIEFLVKSNEGRIKDVDTIFQGQKLLIPDLPAEMFERVPEFDVMKLAAGQGVSMEEFMNSQGRSAPEPASSERKSGAGSDDGAVKSGGAKNTSPAKNDKAAGKTIETSAVRLSLSGLVPVKPTPLSPAATAKNSAAGKNDKTDPKAKTDTKGDQLYRWYEVKPNDTLGTIARKELGSSQHWPEIRKLNSGIDPQKMQVGERIKLPLKPVSTSSGRGRPSA